MILQQFYKASLPPIALEIVNFASLTIQSVSRLIATIGQEATLGIAASFGKKCVLETLAFSTETRVLMIIINANSKKGKRQKDILSSSLLCNDSLEKHGFFMERIAAGLHLDLDLRISNAFDVTSDGDRRGSMAGYKGVLVRGMAQHPIDESAVERIFTEQPFIQSRADLFALRAWACYIGVKGLVNKPGLIDTSAKDLDVRSKLSITLGVFI